MNVEDRIKELEQIIETMQQSLYRDSLTGLYNRIGFYDALFREWGRAERHQSPVSVIFLDMDQLKATNAHYGHDGGDRILAAVGHVIGDVIKRPADIPARIMGDEFAVLLPDTGIAGAKTAAQRIITAIADARIENKAVASGYASATCGIAAVAPDRACPPNELINAASREMLANKRLKQVA